MNPLKILVVEDNQEDINTCESTKRKYIQEKERQINLIFCKTEEEALKEVDSSFDGAIIDLRLGNDGNEGDKFIKKSKHYGVYQWWYLQAHHRILSRIQVISRHIKKVK